LSKREVESDTPQDEKAPSMGAKSLCIPFEQPVGITKGETPCANPNCKSKAEKWFMFGRSY
jgi:prolyl-tRNA synthetase